jgi:hypothetical protein
MLFVVPYCITAATGFTTHLQSNNNNNNSILYYLCAESTANNNNDDSLNVILFHPRRKLSDERISIIGHSSAFLHTELLPPLFSCPSVPLLGTRPMRCHFTSVLSALFLPRSLRSLCHHCHVLFNSVDIGNPFRPCTRPVAAYWCGGIILTIACS